MAFLCVLSLFSFCQAKHMTLAFVCVTYIVCQTFIFIIFRVNIRGDNKFLFKNYILLWTPHKITVVSQRVKGVIGMIWGMEEIDMYTNTYYTTKDNNVLQKNWFINALQWVWWIDPKISGWMRSDRQIGQWIRCMGGWNEISYYFLSCSVSSYTIHYMKVQTNERTVKRTEWKFERTFERTEW